MTARSLTVVGFLAGLAAAPVSAQSTGLPIFQAPYRAFETSELGGMFADPGSGYALQGFYRYGYKAFDIGFLAGFADPDGGDTRFLTGLDLRTRVIDHTERFPLDGALTLGLGGSFAGDGDVGFVPIGLSLGRRFALENSSTSIVPYVHPTVTPTFGDHDDVLVTLGLGVDVRVGRRLDLRVSAGLGDLDGIALGISIIR